MAIHNNPEQLGHPVTANALKHLKKEQLRRLRNQLYQKEPMIWLKERLGEDPLNFVWSERPGYLGKKVQAGAVNVFDKCGYDMAGKFWDGDVDPIYSAWRAIARQQWAAIEAATGTSKTYALSRIVFWFLDCFPNSLVVTSAPKQAQLTLHLWSEIAYAFPKFKKIRPKAALYTLRLVVEEEDANKRDNEDDPLFSKSWQAVGFVAGVGTAEKSATKAQGFHRENMLIITEETPGMPGAVMNAFKNTCTGENNIILAVGNPDSQLEPLHQFAILPNVANYRISAYDYPNVVEGVEIIPGAVTRASIDRRKVDYGVTSDMYQSRVRGKSPAQGIDSLIKLEWLKHAVKAYRDGIIEYDNSFHSVGVDAANSIEGDKACLAWMHGNILQTLQDFQCPNATHLGYNLFMETSELHANGYMDYETGKLSEHEVMNEFIGVDVVGIGVATLQALQDNGYNPIGLSGAQWDEAVPVDIRIDEKTGKEITKPKYKFQNIRAQMYWELREDFRLGLIGIAIDDESQLEDLFLELISVNVIVKDNFIAIEGKDAIKKKLGGKSPNKADAVVYANWTRKGYRITGGGLPIFA